MRARARTRWGNTVNYVDRACCRIPPDPTYRYHRCPTDNENAYPCLAKLLEELPLHSSRVSLSASEIDGSSTLDGIACTRKFRTCGSRLGLSRKSWILLLARTTCAYVAFIACIFSLHSNVHNLDGGTRTEAQDPLSLFVYRSFRHASANARKNKNLRIDPERFVCQGT